MAIKDFAKRSGRGLVVAAAVAATVALSALSPAQAWVSNGAAVGIGLGSLALGTAIGASARPYGYYPYGGYYAPPPPAYYAPAYSPGYYPPARSCWDPYYGRYYAC